MYSLSLAREICINGFYCLNADVLFHPQILGLLIESPHEDVLTVDLNSILGYEEMKVRLNDDRIIEIDKNIDPEVADGESLGVLKFGSEGAIHLHKKIEALLDIGNRMAWAPYAFNHMIPSYPLHYVSIGSLPWIEVDDHQDYAEAVRMSPSLQQD